MSSSVLFRTRDSFGDVSVEQDARLRILRFGTRHRQSVMSLENPQGLMLAYTHAMAMALLFEPQPKRVLVIGLGGGSLVKFLLHHFPACHVDAVEMRQTVVAVARQYFMLPKYEPRLHVHVEDGQGFVEKAAHRVSRCYDLILVDAFDAEGPSSMINQPEFLRACKHLLTLSGVVAISDWVCVNDGYPERRRQRAMIFDDQALTLALGHDRANVINFLFRRPISSFSMHQILMRATQVQRTYGFHCVGYLNDIARQNFHGSRSRRAPVAM